ncbi:hypothetical protein LEMLEM_LOCUS11980 [Lemmus lemmus]
MSSLFQSLWRGMCSSQLPMIKLAGYRHSRQRPERAGI